MNNLTMMNLTMIQKMNRILGKKNAIEGQSILIFGTTMTMERVNEERNPVVTCSCRPVLKI